MAGGTARAAVFGVSDGLVSNVSLILGFAGSGADSSIVRLAGLAGAVAGGISMAAGEWVSVSAQNELIERELEVERRELQRNPTAETDELAGMYEADGMAPEHARRAAADVMRRPEEALAVHARAELGVDPEPGLAVRVRQRRRWCASCSAPCCRSCRGVVGVRDGADDRVRRHRRRRRGRRRRARSAGSPTGRSPARSPARC